MNHTDRITDIEVLSDRIIARRKEKMSALKEEMSIFKTAWDKVFKFLDLHTFDGKSFDADSYHQHMENDMVILHGGLTNEDWCYAAKGCACSDCRYNTGNMPQEIITRFANNPVWAKEITDEF